MSERLPSLDLLRGFEAAARLLSFTDAGRELHLTQSAVSRQVQALEEHLGVDLFERRHRAILLTEAGQLLYRTASGALRQIDDITGRLKTQRNAPAITVSCTLGFASLWLVPRLSDFHLAHPDIDLRISANNQILDLRREKIEVAIRYCPSELAPPGAIRLFGEEAFPVCSPNLLNDAARPLSTPADLKHHVLLHLELPHLSRPSSSWAMWLEMAGQAHLKPAGAARFSHYDQLIGAALQGHGVALGTTPLVKTMMKDGKLVAPFEEKLASPRAYHVVTQPDRARSTEVQAFVDWLIAQAAQFEK